MERRSTDLMSGRCPKRASSPTMPRVWSPNAAGLGSASRRVWTAPTGRLQQAAQGGCPRMAGRRITQVPDLLAKFTPRRDPGPWHESARACFAHRTSRDNHELDNGAARPSSSVSADRQPAARGRDRGFAPDCVPVSPRLMGGSQPIDTERPLLHVLLIGRVVELQPMADFLAVLGVVAFVAAFLGLIWCLERV